MRDMTNDIVIYDYRTHHLEKHHFDRADIMVRMYHCSFIIDGMLYSVGGQTTGSRLIEEDLLEINLQNYAHRQLHVNKRDMMPPMSNMKCCEVFYESRYD